MSQPIKVTLTHYSQLMGYNFVYLNLNCPHDAEGQTVHLEKLGISIERLSSRLEDLPVSCERLDRAVVHDIRNELSIISARAQLLHTKSAHQLRGDARLYLQNIVTACDLLIKALKTDDVYATVQKLL